MQIDYNGMEIELHFCGGECATRTSPGEEAYAELDSVIVSDWDEFIEHYGAKGWRPTFAPTLEKLLDIITEKDWDEIQERANKQIGDGGDFYDGDDDYPSDFSD